MSLFLSISLLFFFFLFFLKHSPPARKMCCQGNPLTVTVGLVICLIFIVLYSPAMATGEETKNKRGEESRKREFRIISSKPIGASVWGEDCYLLFHFPPWVTQVVHMFKGSLDWSVLRCGLYLDYINAGLWTSTVVSLDAVSDSHIHKATSQLISLGINKASWISNLKCV